GFRDVTDRHRAAAALEVRARQQAAVAELGQFALAETRLEQVMNRVCVLITQTLAVEFAEVFEIPPDGPEMILRAGIGWDDTESGGATFESVRLRATRAVAFGQPVIARPNDLIAVDGLSGISVAIRSQCLAVGVLGAHSISYRTFSQDDIHFL